MLRLSLLSLLVTGCGASGIPVHVAGLEPVPQDSITTGLARSATLLVRNAFAEEGYRIVGDSAGHLCRGTRYLVLGTFLRTSSPRVDIQVRNVVSGAFVVQETATLTDSSVAAAAARLARQLKRRVSN